MKQLFGTDGIRGKAGDFPLDSATVAIIGRSLAVQFEQLLGRPPRFISGRDTRESGRWIEEAITDGAKSAGAEMHSAGIITTPGVAYLTGSEGFDAGIVISASHNPFEDNGIKVFLPTGKKMDESFEREIERDIYNSTEFEYKDRGIYDSQAGKYQENYLSHLTEMSADFDLSGIKLVLDCANGAASQLAPALFTRLGADVVSINDIPDGRNINLNCGSLHMDELRKRVALEAADLGVAFDGDADRALFVDEKGETVDGDAVLWVLAKNLRAHGELHGNRVVATVMSNIGLERALASENILLDRTSVGDKYVLQELLETGASLGGEQSGHIIVPARSLVGDGMQTALLLLQAVLEAGKPVSNLTEGFIQYPQVLVNVKVADKRPFDDVPEIRAARITLERDLGSEGRLLLRYSGTENLARVMIEGKDQATIESQAKEMAALIESALS